MVLVSGLCEAVRCAPAQPPIPPRFAPSGATRLFGEVVTPVAHPSLGAVALTSPETDALLVIHTPIERGQTTPVIGVGI